MTDVGKYSIDNHDKGNMNKNSSQKTVFFDDLVIANNIEKDEHGRSGGTDTQSVGR